MIAQQNDLIKFKDKKVTFAKFPELKFLVTLNSKMIEYITISVYNIKCIDLSVDRRRIALTFWLLHYLWELS